MWYLNFWVFVKKHTLLHCPWTTVQGLLWEMRKFIKFLNLWYLKSYRTIELSIVVFLKIKDRNHFTFLKFLKFYIWTNMI